VALPSFTSDRLINVTTVHVIGAGLAGLAAATLLASKGWKVALYEATAKAGGRCRSFHSPALNQEIDNGTHILFRCNVAALHYLSLIGTRQQFSGSFPYRFHSADALTNEVNKVILPFRHPSLDASGRKELKHFLFHKPEEETTVAAWFDEATAFYQNIIVPYCESALNTPPSLASARVLWQVMRESLVCAPWKWGYLLPRAPLQQVMIEPAIRFIEAHGGQFHPHARLIGLERCFDNASALHLHDEEILLGRRDKIILAVSWQQAASLLPQDIPMPRQFCAIQNQVFNLPQPSEGTTTAPHENSFIQVMNGHSHWIRRKGNLIYTTRSAVLAEDITKISTPEVLAEEATRLLKLSSPLSADSESCQTILEKRATFAATPANQALRPELTTPLGNLFLAGDYVKSFLPSTLEGAIRSGFHAAERVMGKA
jgi:squalene-associated FAD-dependent desaturase